MMIKPLNFKKWIDEHRHLLKPPVNNQVVYKDTDFIIMVVGGPNVRKDYHYNEGEEFFYQLEGDMTLRIMEDGKRSDISIKEGEIFLLPPRVYHSPQRFANTIGLVVERKRSSTEKDALVWFCEQCNQQLHREEFHLGNIENIVNVLPDLMNNFYASEKLKTCKCGATMEIPKLKSVTVE